MRTPIGRLPLFVLLALLAACGFERIPAVGGGSGVASFTATAGDQQTAAAGSALPTMLEVTALDGSGRGVEDLTVDFAATNGATLSSPSVRTDVDGHAQIAVVLGTLAGSNAISATADGVGSGVTFTELGVPGAASHIVKTSGDGQSGTAGSAVAPIVATIEDANANPIAGAGVVLAVSQGSGALSATSATSDGAGQVTATWTLGPTAGANAVDVSIAGGPDATFTATGLAGAAAQIVAVSGAGVNASVGSTIDLVAAVQDIHGNGIPNVVVGFAVSEGGGHVSAGSGVSDGSGQVSTVLTLSGSPGASEVTASAIGLTALAIDDTAVVGNPTKLVRVSPASPPSGTVGTAVVPYEVEVEDDDGNPVEGASVSFVITQGNGSLSTGSGSTNAAGETSTALTLGFTSGSNVVEARAPGLANSPIVFTATGLAGPAVRIESGTPTLTGGFYRTAPGPLVARVTDMHGNAVSGTQVAFTVTAGDGVVGAASATSDATGVAQVSYELGAPGANTAQASVTGLMGSPVTFTATATSFTTVAIDTTNTQYAAGGVWVSDLDGDGRPDLMTTPSLGGDLRSFVNATAHGSPTVAFGSGVDVLCGSDTASPEIQDIADFNRDGKPDLLVYTNVNGGDSTVGEKICINTTLSETSPIGFSSSFTLSTTTSDAVALDVNRDGTPDVVSLSADNNVTFAVYLNGTAAGAPALAFGSALSVGTTRLGGSLLVADINADGVLDLIVDGDQNGTIELDTTAAGSSTPTFTRSINASVGTDPIAVDLNGDGLVDLVGAGTTATIEMNTTVPGSLTASFHQSSVAGFLNVPVYVADFNGDGKPDLAVGTRMFINNTPTSATTPTFFPAFTVSVTALGAADFNGDGKPDLVAATSAGKLVIFVQQ